MKGVQLIFSFVFLHLLSFSQVTETFTDERDGHVYKVVTIGKQTMMAENFAYKPQNGNCWGFDNDETNVSKYGYLYDWETAKTMAPNGWHLPTKDEWKALYANTGDDHLIVFENLIESGNFGFNALFGGSRNSSSAFTGLGSTTEFWSSSADEDGNPWSFDFDTDFYRVSFSTKDPSCGFSVRLFKDE
jgi:uncharacterized protein (TIGR02145 family)